MIARIVYPLSPGDSFPVGLDFTKWLDGESISSVQYSAVRLDTGADASSVVLVQNKCSNTTTLVKPWIKAGDPRVTYQVTVTVTSDSTATLSVKIRFLCS